jgi:hypothetical protein
MFILYHYELRFCGVVYEIICSFAILRFVTVCLVSDVPLRKPIRYNFNGKFLKKN